MKLSARFLIGLCALALPVAASAAPAPRPADWSAYGYDAAGTRFSPLDQITPQNVSRLQPAWTYHMNTEKQARAPFATTTPLVVGNRLFLGTPYGTVVALDPTSGREIWRYRLPPNDQPSFRGVAYWPGDGSHAPRIIIPTLRGALIAVDAETGTPSKGFGIDGVVDTKTPEILNGFPEGFYSYSAPPVIYKNLAIIGSRVQEAPSKGPSGDARAWDLVTGKLVWTFHGIPRPGEPFHETWEGDSWRGRSGVNIWHMPTVDAERGIAFLPFGAPTFDRYGGDRKGENLFANSLVAVDANTGKYLWHFQAVHHDIWDYDLPSAPTLVTVHKDGKAIPAVAAMSKTSLLFLLDRVTGKPIYDVVETPVPASSVASEAAWPTQPIPTKPGILTRMSFDLSELADITPEHTAACRKIVEDGGLTGTKMFEPLRADHGTVRFPGGAGGVEWGGLAYEPRLGYLIFASNQIGYVEQLVQQPDGEWNMKSARFVDPKTRSPCQKTPWGELIAVDVNSGEVAWRSLLGVTDAFPEGKKETGRPANAGPILTAGGVAFVGGTDDQRFRAFDTKTGKELWTYKLDYSAHANPITYQGADGRQYVAVVVTGGSYLNSPSGGDSLMVFALPR